MQCIPKLSNIPINRDDVINGKYILAMDTIFL